jgi:energy-coupling factor transporter ATP-binding protein EcfA2
MRIANLEIANFKAIRHLRMNNLGDVVVVAGPNGCGKSCILDAIRFLKSAYAGYRQQNEWHHFFSEFQLNMENADEVRRLFFDRAVPITISADFVLSDSEIDYVKRNINSILRRAFNMNAFGNGRSLLQLNRIQRQRLESNKNDIERHVDEVSAAIIHQLSNPSHRAQLTLDQTPSLTTEENLVLEFAFSVYDPTNLGIIDYHSANRTYQRERLGGINVNIEETSQRLAQHALYNWQNKYHNIKSELAAAYIRDIFVEKAGGNVATTPSILVTMKELFDQFLPGKSFTGPVPGSGGELKFPVKMAAGGEHDIDDLSSGEKELVYGYLRLRNVAPTNSIILLDEPELHLNPRLVLGLPNFYRKHLGLELKNQLWMTTHSDAFLRDAYKGGGFTIFHMSAAGAIEASGNQAVGISADSEINRAIVDLVGDIAGFRPGNVIVVFESSENASFDASMTRRLFPEFFQNINALSGDNKFGVKQLYSALDKAISQMSLPIKVFAIVDRDSDEDQRPSLTRVFSWNVYHIENYLLDENFISKVMKDNPSYCEPMSSDDIKLALKECASSGLRSLIKHRMQTAVNAGLLKCLDLGFDQSIANPAQGFAEALGRVSGRISKINSTEFTAERLDEMRCKIETDLLQSLNGEGWRSEFKGRDILQIFAGKFLRGLPYEAFRDAIVARMGDANHQPAGMREIVSRIADQSATKN